MKRKVHQQLSQNVLEVEFQSEWEEGAVTSKAKLDLATGAVFDIQQSDVGETYQTFMQEQVLVSDMALPVVRQDNGAYHVSLEHLATLQLLETDSRVIRISAYGIEITLSSRMSSISSSLHDEDEGTEAKAALHSVEAMILAHAMAGIDVTSPAYLQGLETTVEAIWNNYGDEAPETAEAAASCPPAARHVALVNACGTTNESPAANGVTQDRHAPAWTAEHSIAAQREGWDLFDCGGRANERLQIQRLDDPEAVREAHGFTPPYLESDDDACRIVANGAATHHVDARAILEAANPDEHRIVMAFKTEYAAKRFSAAELSNIVTMLLTGDAGEIDSSEGFQSFMTDIAKVVCDHCGGEVFEQAEFEGDVWKVGVRGNDCLPAAFGGIWREYGLGAGAVASA